MIEFVKKSIQNQSDAKSVTLPWEKRLKSRLRVSLDCGLNAGIFLPRGTILRGGDYLLSEDGISVLVIAAPEKLTTVSAPTSLLLSVICYHLGNRHVALEISEDKVSYLHDHVLDEMVMQLGGQICFEEKPFEPEFGAYSGSGHGGNHSHG